LRTSIWLEKPANIKADDLNREMQTGGRQANPGAALPILTILSIPAKWFSARCPLLNNAFDISSGLEVAAPGTGALRGRGDVAARFRGYAALTELGGLFEVAWLQRCRPLTGLGEGGNCFVNGIKSVGSTK